jgi:hypothetical protein
MDDNAMTETEAMHTNVPGHDFLLTAQGGLKGTSTPVIHRVVDGCLEATDPTEQQGD